MAKSRAKRAVPSARGKGKSPSPKIDPVRPVPPVNGTPTGGGTQLVHVLAQARAILEESRHILANGSNFICPNCQETAKELVGHIDDHLPKLNDAITVIDEAAGDAGDTAEAIGGES